VTALPFDCLFIGFDGVCEATERQVNVAEGGAAGGEIGVDVDSLLVGLQRILVASRA
jgi:hypothetical protein